MRLRAIFSYLVELALLKTESYKECTFFVVLVNDFFKKLIEEVVSEGDSPADDWVASRVDESDIFFKIVGFFSGLGRWIYTDEFIVFI